MLMGRCWGNIEGPLPLFVYELTPYIIIGKANELRVEVDNIQRQDIPPLSGDFNVNGGLYRPAQLIVTDQVCVSPLDYASSGVYITTENWMLIKLQLRYVHWLIMEFMLP